MSLAVKKLKRSYGKSNIDKIRVTARIVLQNIISKYEQIFSIKMLLNSLKIGFSSYKRTYI